MLAETPSTTIGGKAVIDLEAGETKSVNIQMKLHDTKLIIPDFENYRVVQVDNMNGDEWNEIDVNSLLPDYTSQQNSQRSDFRPRKVDCDNLGRIYILSDTYNNFSSYGNIIRINNINSCQLSESMDPDMFDPIIPSSSSFSSFAIDRTNGRICTLENNYGSYMVYLRDLNGNYITDYSFSNFYESGNSNFSEDSISVSSMAIDNNGIIWFCGQASVYESGNEGTRPVFYVARLIIRQDTSSEMGYSYDLYAYANMIGASDQPDGIYRKSLTDMIVKNNTIYMLHSTPYYVQDEPAAIHKMLMVNLDSWGNGSQIISYTAAEIQSMSMPYAFIAPFKPDCYFISDGYQYKEIKQFNYPSGTVVDTYGSAGSERNQFMFFINREI